MKFILIPAVIFLILSTPINAQQTNPVTITGRIIDEETGTPLENVNVFLANTSIGNTTGKNGEFSISGIPLGTYNIIFSYIGYETEKRNFYAYKAGIFNYNILLKPKAVKINEVNITGTIPAEWKENLKVFTRVFIGETKNAQRTKIVNPEVLNFVRDKKTSILKAYSDSILIVENKALGYLLYIVLDWLEYFPEGNIKYMFYPRFKELIPVLEEEKHVWENNRQTTYINSPKHFFYDLVHKQLHNNYYSLREGSVIDLQAGKGDKIFPADLELISNSDSTAYELKYRGGLAIRRYLDPPSYLDFYYPSTTIDEYGNLLTPYYTVEIYGYWADLRIADILPLDYVFIKK